MSQNINVHFSMGFSNPVAVFDPEVEQKVEPQPEPISQERISAVVARISREPQFFRWEFDLTPRIVVAPSLDELRARYVVMAPAAPEAPVAAPAASVPDIEEKIAPRE